TKDEIIAGLAEADDIQYDQRRRAAAKELGIRATTLDAEVAKVRGDRAAEAEAATVPDIEPSPKRVNGNNLLGDIAEELERYVILPAYAADAIALWILHAHCHDAAEHSAILAISSPTPECGKTTVATFVKCVVPRPYPVISATGPVLFRVIEERRPTLLLDEA